MKCLCGYEGLDFDQLKNKVNQGNTEALFFINSKFVFIYACPKCGTLKIEVSNEN